MKTKQLIFAALLAPAFIFHSCGYEGQNIPPEKGVESQNNQDHLIMSALFVQLSAEYKAQCYQAYNAASMSLIQKTAGNQIAKPAVVLDLDETVLDNSPYAGFQIESGLPYSPKSWKEWTAKANAATIPGAKEFLKLADSLGVTLFYVSNRRVEELESTRQNMKDLGLPQIADSNFLLRDDASEKESRRNKITEKGYEVLLFCGDQLGDFHQYWDEADNPERSKRAEEQKHKFGRDYIILPNPVYGIWERNLFKDSSYTAGQKNKLRKKAINAFQPQADKNESRD